MITRALVLVLAAVGPLAFPAAQRGYASLHDLAVLALVPSVAGLLAVWSVVRRTQPELASRIARGAAAGAVATLALEAVRYPGFRLGFMPGNLPQLMGVLLLDRFVLGPSVWSDLAGFAYHFWNGAVFGVIFTVVTGGRSPSLAVVYGLGIGLGFLGSPVVQSLGVGLFGRDFGWPFAATVLTAHAAYGAVLGGLLARHGFERGSLPGGRHAACRPLTGHRVTSLDTRSPPQQRSDLDETPRTLSSPARRGRRHCVGARRRPPQGALLV